MNDPSSDCASCHMADYESSTYPGHDQFPTTCGDCHDTTSWAGASAGTHPESRFPITSGAHRGIACGNCHDASLSARAIENVNCIGCHLRSHVDPEHDEVGGYRWSSSDHAFCLRCHAGGGGGEGGEGGEGEGQGGGR